MRSSIAARIFALVIGLAFFNSAFAVELGRLFVDSLIDQPLRVRILLDDLGETALEEISVQIASEEDFTRLKVEKVASVSSISIDIESVDGIPYVVLTSSAAINDSYVDLVLDTRWASGRVLTQHTILLDPPVFADTEVAAPPVTVTTDRSSTLYSIAMAARPDSSVTVQQTMLAIQRLNPRSFGDGNINRLYAGEVLRLPSLEQINELDAAQALTAVREQNLQNQTQASSVAGGSLQNESSSEDRLSVVVAIDKDASSEETEELDRRITELEAQLAISQEELARVAREREEFMSRLAAIESQIVSAQEIIRLQDAQLAELTQSLAAAAEVRAEVPEISTAAPSDTKNFTILLLVLVIAVLVVVLLLFRRSAIRDDEESENEVIEFAAEPMSSVARNLNDSEPANSSQQVGRKNHPDWESEGTFAAGELDRELASLKMAMEETSTPKPSVSIQATPITPAFNPDELAFGSQEHVDNASAVVSQASSSNAIDEEEAATKLELAYAYHKMGDDAGAVEILSEVLEEGSEAHKQEAESLLSKLRSSKDGAS